MDWLYVSVLRKGENTELTYFSLGPCLTPPLIDYSPICYYLLTL
jgi:hypothetical protein